MVSFKVRTWDVLFREVPYFVDSNLKSSSQNCKNLFNRSIARATLSICIAFPALNAKKMK